MKMEIPKSKFNIGDSVYILASNHIKEVKIIGKVWGRFFYDMERETDLTWHYVGSTSSLCDFKGSDFFVESRLFANKGELLDDLLNRSKK